MPAWLGFSERPANRHMPGLYEQQDENQTEHNLRGKFVTDANGEYAFYTIRPTPYPVPYDGPAGKLLQLMDKHPYRPAHIHVIVSLPVHTSHPLRPS